jgi:hypothetical protein
MAPSADSHGLAAQARRLYAAQLSRGLVALVQAVLDEARARLDQPADHATLARRRDVLARLGAAAPAWHRRLVHGLRLALSGVAGSRSGSLSLAQATSAQLALVDDDSIEIDILASRLALAVTDRASWEFADVRARVGNLERRAELEPGDLLRPPVLARLVIDAWRAAGLPVADWRELQTALHDEFAVLAEEACHEVNHWLIGQGVLPEVDLRPFVRRNRTHAVPVGWAPTVGAPPAAPGVAPRAAAPVSAPPTSSSPPPPPPAPAPAQPRTEGERERAEAVLARLDRLVARQAGSFAATAGGSADGAPLPLSPALSQAIDATQRGIRQRFEPEGPAHPDAGQGPTAPALLEELHRSTRALERAAATPAERATIEIVALMFQSILTEERIPAAVRVWFARLQMPVLRVAVAEPGFFAVLDHPARRLIDRMGACVMGFDSAARGTDAALEREIRRVVQVVEAYPDTGRRVFQTVLTEFERFLEHYFRTEYEASRRGVSLAEQIEQREALAIGYTIELRRMLSEMQVQEGVRDFLFQVWADVLATAAVGHGAQGEVTREMKRAAADLIWSAGAKVTREERAEVLRRLPALLRTLRAGMSAAGMHADRQDEHIRQLNNALAAAFSARSAVVPDSRLREMMARLESLEELLPERGHVEVDESIVLDLSGHRSDELEVVLEGGTAPEPAARARAGELQVGAWYLLSHGGRTQPVQLAWHGLRRQLSLFVGRDGRCLLFQRHRLAAHLQAGLLVAAQHEALTVAAARNALARLDAATPRP